MRVVLTKAFSRMVRKAGLTDSTLRQAALEIDQGMVEARLGGCLVKKRLARAGEGKSGGFRTIVAHRQGSRIFFLYVFAKNEKGNIDAAERTALLALGNTLMRLDDMSLDAMVVQRALREIADETEPDT